MEEVGTIEDHRDETVPITDGYCTLVMPTLLWCTLEMLCNKEASKVIFWE